MRRAWPIILILVILALVANKAFSANPRNTKPKQPDEIYQNDKDLWDSMNKMRWLSEYTPDTIGADQNDYQIGNYNVLRLSSDASRNITGIQGGRTGRWIIFINVGSNNIVLKNQSASSTAANRIISNTGADYTVNASSSTFVYYDAVTDRWRILFN